MLFGSGAAAGGAGATKAVLAGRACRRLHNFGEKPSPRTAMESIRIEVEALLVSRHFFDDWAGPGQAGESTTRVRPTDPPQPKVVEKTGRRWPSAI